MHNPNEITPRTVLAPSEHRALVERVLANQLVYWNQQHEQQKCDYCRVEEIKAAMYSLVWI